MQGAADHGVSEALYLADEDGNGIEIYRDRPRDEWPMVGGRLQMGADPLDLDALLADGRRAGRRRPGRRNDDRPRAPARRRGSTRPQRFYVDVLGFDLMQRYGPSALFVVGRRLSPSHRPEHVGRRRRAAAAARRDRAEALRRRAADRRAPGARVAEARRPAESRPKRIDGGLLIRDPARNAILLDRRQAGCRRIAPNAPNLRAIFRLMRACSRRPFHCRPPIGVVARGAQTPAFDLLIQNGRIVDGTGSPGIAATSPCAGHHRAHRAANRRGRRARHRRRRQSRRARLHRPPYARAPRHLSGADRRQLRAAGCDHADGRPRRLVAAADQAVSRQHRGGHACDAELCARSSARAACATQ